MAKENQNNAIIGLNESALEIFNSMQEMQNSGSASGYEQFLSMMQEMSEQQQSLNQQRNAIKLRTNESFYAESNNERNVRKTRRHRKNIRAINKRK